MKEDHIPARDLAQQRLDERLFESCSEGDVLLARLAIAAGADVNARDISSSTPLHYASIHKESELASMLIAAGADIHAKDSGDSTPLHWAAYGKASEIVAILITSGADVKAKDCVADTPLDIATQNGDRVSVAILKTAATQKSHAGRVAEERKDKGPPQVGG